MAGNPETWETGGGALRGTPNQVEWAERIKRQVDCEFDRVSASFRSRAAMQNPVKRTETNAILDILEDKRVDVMSRQDAGYFIREWQEISDQVRQLIAGDARYLAIKSAREARKQEAIE